MKILLTDCAGFIGHPIKTRFRYLWYALLLIPIFIFRDYTPANELKYISIALEALQNNTWFTFYSHGEIYADKPPLFFWLIMTSIHLTGEHWMWLMGLFSLLPAIGVLAIMDKWLKMENAPFDPLTANLMLITSAMFLMSTLVVRMDMLMLFFIVLSLFTFYRIYMRKHKPVERYLLPVYIFLALFTKGAIGFLTPVISIVAFLIIKKRIRSLGSYLGWKQWLIFAGLCGVWFTGVYVEGGGAYLHNLVFKQTVGRGINSFHHNEPVWYYFPRMLWSFAPWSLLFIALITWGILKKVNKTNLQKFFLTIITVNIIMLSLISSKLDIYLLPVYPFVVYLCSTLLTEYRSNNKLLNISIGIPAVILIVTCLAAILFGDTILLYFTAQHYEYGIIPYLGAICLLAGSIIAFVMILKRQIIKSITALAVGFLGTLCITAFALPQFNQYAGYGEMAKSVNTYAANDPALQYASYKSSTLQNMDVYLSGNVLLVESFSNLDSLNSLNKNTILFVRNRDVLHDEELAQFVSTRYCGWKDAEYSWYLIGQNKE